MNQVLPLSNHNKEYVYVTWIRAKDINNNKDDFLSKPLSNKLWQIVPRNFPYCKILLGNT